MILRRNFLFIKRDRGAEESTLRLVRQIIIFGSCVSNNGSYFYERMQKKKTIQKEYMKTSEKQIK
jgi:hypothetical protein